RPASDPRRREASPSPAAGYRREASPPAASGRSPTMKWGSVARRGARSLERGNDAGPSASDVWRETVARVGGDRDPREREAWTPDETWVVEPAADHEEVSPRRSAPRAGRRPQPRDLATGREGIASPGGRRRRVPRPVLDELSALSGPDRGDK